MFKSRLGYVFECRGIKPLDQMAVKEEYSCSVSGDMKLIEASFGLDFRLFFTIPTKFSAEEGFINLATVIHNPESAVEDIKGYLKTKRGVYSVLSSTVMICRIKGKLNMHTNMWEDGVRCSFFSPVKYVDIVSEDGKGTVDGVACSLVTSSGKELNSIQSPIVDDLRSRILNASAPYIGSRELFLAYRLGSARG